MTTKTTDNIKRQPAPAARVSGLTRPAVLLFAPWMQAPPASNKTATRAAAFIVPALDASPPAVPGYLASVNAWIHPDSQTDNAARLARYTGTIQRPAASTAAVQNGPKRPNAAPWPNGLNTPERPERPERLKVTRTNDPNELNELNGLKQAHRYPGGVFKPERLERLN